jgi:hypothetical protein
MILRSAYNNFLPLLLGKKFQLIDNEAEDRRQVFVAREYPISKLGPVKLSSDSGLGLGRGPR